MGFCKKTTKKPLLTLIFDYLDYSYIKLKIQVIYQIKSKENSKKNIENV